MPAHRPFAEIRVPLWLQGVPAVDTIEPVKGKRVIRLDCDDLDASLQLPPAERLRQANAAFRLYHALHHPFDRPFARGFDTLEEFFQFERENDFPR